MIYAGVEELKEQYFEQADEQAEKARTEGRAEGGISLVRRQARLKFGAGTAEEFSGLVGRIFDPEAIARIGHLIIECETGAELLARAREDCQG